MTTTDAQPASAPAARTTTRSTTRGVGEATTRATGEAPAPGSGDTRTRIQQVALELFTNQGYEATSLREIAQRLGVTKAALYYHFRTKDEIIESMVADRVAKIDELVRWAREQPRTNATRLDFLRRYSTLLHEHGHHAFMRFFERNQSSMAQHKAGTAMRTCLISMLDLLSDRDAPLPEQIRCSLAIFALHSTWFVIRDPEVTDDQRRLAALEVALGLVSPAASGGSGTG